MADPTPPRQSLILQDISPEAVQELFARGRTLAFERGQELFRRGDQANELMILDEGVVELFFPIHIMGATRELIVESKEPGEVVAWSALVAPYQFTLSARCASHCALTALSRSLLHAFFAEDPASGYLFMRNLAGVIGGRLHNLQDLWINELQSGTA